MGGDFFAKIGTLGKIAFPPFLWSKEGQSLLTHLALDHIKMWSDAIILD